MFLRYVTAMIVVTAGSVRADVISYEGTSFPEKTDQGWERETFCEPERRLDESGSLVQVVEVGCGGPPGGDKDLYERSLGDFEGEAEFFIQWRMQTDADRSEIPGSAVVLSAWSSGAVNYHFTIARDQVRLIRDNRLPIIFVDIEPGLFHTFRLELYEDELYVWYIDGQVVDAGIPEGAYPSFFPSLGWRARPWYLDSTTQWDYIRFGTIAAEGSGDYDSDEDVDLRDFYFFDECLANGGPDTEAGPGCLWADLDGDGNIDFEDFGRMQLAFTGGE